jgi:hypothetical protein
MNLASSEERTATEWLVASEDPAVRYLARRDLLGEDAADDAALILAGGHVRDLLSGARSDGGFGVHPYHKWTGAHWRCISLVELGIPPGEPRAMAAANTVLDWLTSTRHRSRIPVIDGLTRRHASQEGNALAVSCRLGMQVDARVALLARSLMEWQWPDGGWNCDNQASGRRSSFHESLPPMWGLHEYAVATGDADAAVAARRTAELFLDHRLFRSSSTGAPIHEGWLKFRYPPYWHYDVLQALLILSRMGLVGDDRTADALQIVEARRGRDGLWRASGYWWSPPGAGRYNVEVTDWNRGGPNEMITLNALRVLLAAR